MTKALKRAAWFLLSIVLVFMMFAVPAAQPVQAVAVSAVVISAVLAAMAVWGVSTITAGMTAAEIQDWVSTKLNSWASSKSSTVANLIPISGISVTATALLVLGNGVANAIKDFVSWLQNDVTLTPGTTTTVSSVPSSYGGVQMSYSPSGAGWDRVIKYGYNDYRLRIWSIYDYPIYGFAQPSNNGTYWNINVLSEGPFIVTLYSANMDGTVYQTDTYESGYSEQYGYYYRTSYEKQVDGYTNTPPFMVYNNDAWSMIDVRNNTATVGKSLDLQTDVSYNLPVDLVDPESLYLNTGAAIGATVEGVTDHVITGVVENTLDVSGTIAEEAPPYEVTGPVQVPGIQNIFPFCIPFDLYSFISCLYAEPEAPHFTWRFYIPNICDEEIEIDLAPFNTVAAIMRTMFLLLFCVGLAYETRKLLRS